MLPAFVSSRCLDRSSWLLGCENFESWLQLIMCPSGAVVHSRLQVGHNVNGNNFSFVNSRMDTIIQKI